MSDLLKKGKSNLLEKSNAPKPQNTFGREKIFAAKNIKETKKTTTIRCDTTVSNHLNAITAVMNLDSVNELIEIMVNNHVGSLTQNEQREVKTIKKIYDKRN